MMMLHVELVMPFVWKRPFEAPIEAKPKNYAKRPVGSGGLETAS